MLRYFYKAMRLPKPVTVKLTLTLCVISALLVSSSWADKLYPVDEAPKDPSFHAFRKKLMKAVKNRDTTFILSILDENIINSFGGNDGIEGFKEQWKPDSPDSTLWETLYTVLSMGGSFAVFENQKTFCAPYVFSTWDRVGNFDAFEYYAVTGKNVKLRKEPGITSHVLLLLSYDIVKQTNDKSAKKDGHTWLQVETLSGKKGYVSDKFVRSPIDYRACFKKVKNNWRMTNFVAGD